jgi:hypothetical protein
LIINFLLARNLFGRAASRTFGALASGYALHHLLALRAAQVVPLLSLSLFAPMVRAGFARELKMTIFCFYSSVGQTYVSAQYKPIKNKIKFR